MPILGKVRHGNSNKYAAEQRLWKDVPEPIVGKVAMKVIMHRVVRALPAHVAAYDRCSL